MTTEENQAQVDAERFTSIADRLKAGEDLSNDDALFLLRIISSLDGSYLILNTTLSSAARHLEDMAKAFGFAVLQRAGRTDQKIKKSVLKMADTYVSAFWGNVQQDAAEAAYSRIAVNIPLEEAEDAGE